MSAVETWARICGAYVGTAGMNEPGTLELSASLSAWLITGPTPSERDSFAEY